MTFYLENLIFIPIGLLFILLVIFLASFLSGWYFISKRNPLPYEIGKLLGNSKSTTININYYAAYRGIINVDITEKGILLKPSFFFLVLHSPIFIVWKKIKRISYKSGRFERVIFYAGNTRFVVYGTISKEIFKFKSKYTNELESEGKSEWAAVEQRP